ncbi:MAG: hypothetical protein IT363_01470 [Methanoregulaceae archaeon]|nr:hypothetical protein [Methanoregulaceae archaeon]
MRNGFWIRLVAVVIAIAIIFGCGGGGGGGTSGGGGGGTDNGVSLTPKSAALSFGQVLSLTGVVPGQANQVIRWSATGGSIAATGASSAQYTAPGVAGTFVITGRADANQNLFGTCVVTVSQVGVSIDPVSTTVAPGGSVSFTATVTGATNQNVNFTATGGTITKVGNIGTYTAGTTAGNFSVTASSVADPAKRATASVTIANTGANATVTGRVVQDGTQSGIAGIVVAFYNSTGSEVARVTTGADGRFSRLVPTSARRFHLIPTSIPNAYYKQYSYAGTRYTPLVSSCSVPLPTLNAGQTYAMPVSVMIPSAAEPPPPPPNGCS